VSATAPRTGVWKRLPTPAELAGGALPPVVLLTGTEEYLMEECFQLFWQHVTDPAMADFNRDLFYADEARSEELFAQAASFPMMAERRLVVVRRCEKAPAPLLNDLLVYLDRASPSTCLLLCAASVDKRRKVWTRLLKEAAVFEFPPLKQDGLAAWLARTCAELGRTLPQPLAWRLAEQLTAAPLRMARQEAEKLCLLAAEGGEISEEDLATALGMEPDAMPFHLANAVQDGNLTQALAVLQSLLRNPDNAYMLVGMLGKSLGRLWFIGRLRERGLGEREISERLSLNEYSVKRSLPQLRHWPAPRLEEALRLLLEADMSLKGDSPLPPSQIYFQLVVRLCRLP
jgi:DNA polymerase III subunit delta